MIGSICDRSMDTTPPRSTIPSAPVIGDGFHLEDRNIGGPAHTAKRRWLHAALIVAGGSLQRLRLDAEFRTRFVVVTKTFSGVRVHRGIRILPWLVAVLLF